MYRPADARGQHHLPRRGRRRRVGRAGVRSRDRRSCTSTRTRCRGCMQAGAAQRQVAVREQLRELSRRRSAGARREAPSLVDIGNAAHARRDCVQVIAPGHGPNAGLRRRRSTTTPSTRSSNFLITGRDVAETAANNPNFLKYRSTGSRSWLDPDGYPPITPPWGTLNAIDLNKGEIRWTIPFGEYPKLVGAGDARTPAPTTTAGRS